MVSNFHLTDSVHRFTGDYIEKLESREKEEMLLPKIF